MTHNLPARSAGFGPRDVPLSDAPSIALAFALGYAAARPVNANSFGPFCALAEELMRRDHRVAHIESQWDLLMSLLPPQLASAVQMLYQAHRGQRWAATGEYPPKSGN